MLTSLLERIVEIEFYDHVSGSEVTELFTCQVWGKLVKVDETKIIVQTWQTFDEKDNDEYVILIRKAIISITPLSVVERTHVL